MRIFLSLILSLFCICGNAQSIEKRVSNALGQIQQGNINDGFDGLKDAAFSNSLAAQYYVGLCYEYGIGVEKNSQEAFAMYRKAAERGLPDAMYRLAVFYQNGTGVTQNESRSAEWMARYEKKKGSVVLPDLIALYNEGIKHTRNYASNNNSRNNKPSVSNNRQRNSSSSSQQRNNNSSTTTSTDVPPLQPIQQTVANVNKPVKWSDVDTDIPSTGKLNSNSFAVIIANENYQEEAAVDYAIHDGQIFAEYCRKTLGIPKENIHFRKNATYNNIKTEIAWMTQVADAFKGKASFIFYYAGHGFPDEASHSPYLLPVDGNGSITSTGYSLAELYKQLGSLRSKGVTVFLDACFSGAQRGEGMLASARGIALKAKDDAPTGKMVVFSAATGQQTAYPYKEKGHGLFTYYLLKELQNTKGNLTYGELADFVSERVSKQSVVINSKAQTPTVTPSEKMAKDWRTIQF